MRPIDRRNIIVLGCKVPLNRPNYRGIRLRVREGVQTERSYFQILLNTQKENVTNGLNISLGDAEEELQIYRSDERRIIYT